VNEVNTRSRAEDKRRYVLTGASMKGYPRTAGGVWASLVHQLFAKFPDGQPLTRQRLEDVTRPGSERVRRAMAARLTIVAGSDMYVAFDMPRGEAAKHTLFAYANAGMPAVGVLRSATSRGERLLRQPRLGHLTNGGLLTSSPSRASLRDIHALERVQFVMSACTIFVSRR
jgi:hypothetical protein